jgi:hypothetical protein
MGGIGVAHADALLSVSLGDTLWLALLTEFVDGGVAGSALPEPSYVGYARLEVLPEVWSTPVGGRAYNTADLVFDACTSGEDRVVGFALVDAETDGAVRSRLPVKS